MFRRVLFASALIALPVAGCGDSSAPKAKSAPDHVAQMKPAPAEQPVVQTPVVPEKPEPLPAEYGEAMALAKKAMTAGDHARARAVLEVASKLEPNKVEPQLELARLFLATGDKSLALSSAKKATLLAPKSSAAFNTLGRAELARNDYDRAITAFEKAVDLNPDNAYAWNNLGFTLLTLELYREAANALEEATSKPNATGYMFNNLGLAYEHMDMLDEARLAFDNGAARGSDAAAKSRARLEGVETIAVYVPPVGAREVENTGNVDENAVVEDAVRAEEELADDGEGDVEIVEDTEGDEEVEPGALDG
jgi:tetratricopeptide (TPR) repeat protein